MKIVLLCAGYATRLYPLTKDQPKSLLPVGGKPIVEHLLEKLEEVRGVDQVFLVSNDCFYSHFKGWAGTKNYPWKMEVVNDGTKTNETRLGAVGDLAFVCRQFKVHDDLGVFAGDNLFRSDVLRFFAFAESHRPWASVGVVDVKERSLARRYGIVHVDAEMGIVEFVEKPKEPASTLASTGIYWFAKENLNLLDRYIHEGHNADRFGDYISWLVKTDRVFAYPFEGNWFDIGDMDSYREADRIFQKAKTQTKI